MTFKSFIKKFKGQVRILIILASLFLVILLIKLNILYLSRGYMAITPPADNINSVHEYANQIILSEDENFAYVGGHNIEFYNISPKLGQPLSKEYVYIRKVNRKGETVNSYCSVGIGLQDLELLPNGNIQATRESHIDKGHHFEKLEFNSNLELLSTETTKIVTNEVPSPNANKIEVNDGIVSRYDEDGKLMFSSNVKKSIKIRVLSKKGKVIKDISEGYTKLNELNEKINKNVNSIEVSHSSDAQKSISSWLVKYKYIETSDGGLFAINNFQGIISRPTIRYYNSKFLLDVNANLAKFNMLYLDYNDSIPLLIIFLFVFICIILVLAWFSYKKDGKNIFHLDENKAENTENTAENTEKTE